MEEIGVVVPAGRGYINDEPTPVDLLAPLQRAQRLADAFESAITDTRWFSDWMHGVDPIPAEVLEELGQVACLCRLADYPDERQAIREVVLTAPSVERTEPTEQRRRAFALLLHLMQATPKVAYSDDDFRDALINEFDANRTGPDARASATAQWAAAAMRDSLQDALSVIWHDFCRAGLRTQPFDGLTRTQLRELVSTQLVAQRSLRIRGTEIPTAPDDSVDSWLHRVEDACSTLGWQELSAIAIEAGDALTGLAVLVVLSNRVPDPTATNSAWLAVARVDGEHQPGLRQMATMLRRRASSETTVCLLMQWVIDTLVVAVHETVAMSKLPESTFRFSWEQGRLRFVDNGVWRFEASGLRRDALASIAYDLGWWAYDDADTPFVTNDGSRVIEDVFTS